MSLGGAAGAQTWTRLNISGPTLPIQPDGAWEALQRRMGESGQKQMWEPVTSYSKTWEAVTAAKDASMKYWVKAVNTA